MLGFLLAWAAVSSYYCIFGICKVAMMLSFQWFQAAVSTPTVSASGWRSDAKLGVGGTIRRRSGRSRRSRPDEAPPAWLIGCIDCEFDGLSDCEVHQLV